MSIRTSRACALMWKPKLKFPNDLWSRSVNAAYRNTVIEYRIIFISI